MYPTVQGPELSWFQKFCANVLKCGRIPNHIALILDGNRRYARKHQLDPEDGHRHGLQKLETFVEWCRDLGIHEVTAYLFSIENCKRTPKEVEAFADLLRAKSKEMCLESFVEKGIGVRFIGNLELLPKDIQKLIADVVYANRGNKDFFVNVALPYTSRNEITMAMKTVVEGIRLGELEVEDVDEELLSRCMYTNHSRDPDVIIRTAGETRFSDFLLWQTKESLVYFHGTLWPEIRFYSLLRLVFFYQRFYAKNEFKGSSRSPNEERDARTEKFVKKVNENREIRLQEFLKISL